MSNLEVPLQFQEWFIQLYCYLFWLEQVRSDGQRAAFVPARSEESRALPLPPEDWIDHYDEANTLVAPNKRQEAE